MTRIVSRRLAAVTLALLAMGADEPTRSVKVQGVAFEVPKSWKSSPSGSPMRLTQFKVDPVEGDTEPAELVLFAFRGGGGTVKANLDRWRAQFQGEDGKPPEIVTETRKGKNADVTFAEAAGRYVAAVTPGSPERHDRPGFRLLGAIVQSPDTGYYFKMVGPDKTMTAAKPAFDAMIKSISIEE